jgi:GTP-binding protein LepA
MRNTRRNIRNFTIIAHVDHGKSTLADRIICLCDAVPPREMTAQHLDNMDLEKEKGITIKSQTVRLNYTRKNGEKFTLNLIDTPGHADFTYEVSRSLKAAEISILLVDATKGVEAQTLANFLKAQQANHEIIPVLNKIDLPTADIKRCLLELSNIGIHEEPYYISAKSGKGVIELVERICDGKSPEGDEDKPLQALIIDSWYDKYLGVVVLARVFNGHISVGMKVLTYHGEKTLTILKLGYFLPHKNEVQKVIAGEICYLTSQIKNPSDVRIGDTICDNKDTPVLDGFQRSNALVWSSFHIEDGDIKKAREALTKYSLNDPAFVFDLEETQLFGICFRCGFLGLLHMEIVLERLEREYGIDCIPSAPSVTYRIIEKGKEEITISDLQNWPKGPKEIFEPEMNCTIWTTHKYIGAVVSLCSENRATHIQIDNIEDDTASKAIIRCKLPLSEMISNFSDQLKSATSGYSSFDAEECGYRKSDLVLLMVLLNKNRVPELNSVVHISKARDIAIKMAEKLKKILPRTQQKSIIQVAMNEEKDVIAREDIDAYRKDVIAKCYGGDITRKKKLLEKQKKGKESRRMGSNILNISKKDVINLIKSDIKT